MATSRLFYLFSVQQAVSCFLSIVSDSRSRKVDTPARNVMGGCCGCRHYSGLSQSVGVDERGKEKD